MVKKDYWKGANGGREKGGKYILDLGSMGFGHGTNSNTQPVSINNNNNKTDTPAKAQETYLEGKLFCENTSDKIADVP